ncbi:hypothetical protein LOZ14_000594 [Ophidiomyces ophidiicola]|nr:hypothetical protein LOZ14_000594 [Ophidiomyces ophidiicola]
MPSILSDADKEIVRRTVPKPANKILAVAVARLYVAYPSPSKWAFTGLQGAAVLANDLVGHTFWIKLVDISPAGRGVLWDQELYDGFSYNQDRTFFHTFELEVCLAGLSFADEKEAKTFLKKVSEREKHASKETRGTPFSSTKGQGPPHVSNGKTHHRFGFGSLLGHRTSSAPTPQPAESVTSPRPIPSDISTASARSATPEKKPSPMDTVDPSWKGILDELLAMGITEEQIAENADFIKSYIESKQNEESQPNVETNSQEPLRKPKAAPPAPPPVPPPVAKTSTLSPQNTGGTSRRGAPPPPPPSRKPHNDGSPSPAPASPPASPKREPSPPRPRFRAPPPIADAGKYAHINAPAPSTRSRASSTSHLATPGPPPPPRPPKTPDNGPARLHPPPPPPQVHNDTKSATPPAPPSRGSVPLPPRRNISPLQPPPLPPKTPHAASPTPAPPPPPPPRAAAVPPPPPRPTSQQFSPTFAAPPPPPPPPPPPTPALPGTTGAPPAPPPPPPSLPGATGSHPTPPPPPPPGGAPTPKPPAGNDDLLASIRAAGGSGLRKVKDSDKRDRSAAIVPGGSNGAPAAAAAAGVGAGVAAGGMMGALQEALAKRKQKVSGSDDEKSDDEW